MKKGNQILIFVLINIVIIGIIVVLPIVPAINIYKAYHFDIPSNIPAKTEKGIETSMFFASLTTVAKNLQTEEGKDALHDIVYLMTEERVEIFYKNFMFIYVALGIIIGIAILTIGIYLKYKLKNKIYSKAFIVAGVIVVIAYIFILSILLQRNTYYSLWW